MTSVYFGRSRFIPSALLKMIQQVGFLAVDMHFHTQYSMDAVSDIRSVLARCRKRGVGVAITDHNEIAGAVKAFSMKKNEFVIAGMEASTQEGAHALYYFYDIRDCKKFYSEVVAPLKKKNPFFLPMGIDKLMEKAKGYNAAIASAHPYGPGVIGIRKVHLKIKMDALNRRFHFVEGLNGCNLRGMNNSAIHWGNLVHKGMTAGSDGHTTFELGNALTLAYGYDAETFLDSVKKGHNILIGKEENLFADALHQIIKEKTYFQRAKEMGLGMFWVKEHAMEMTTLKEKMKTVGKGLPDPYVLMHRTSAHEDKKYYMKLGNGLFK